MNHLSQRQPWRIFIFLLALLLLGACAETPSQEPTSTPPPTPTPEPTAVGPPTAVPLPTPVLLGDYPLLSPADMRYDLDELFRRLETTHPNPYMRRPKAEVDQERARIYDELAQSLTMIDFFRKVAPLVNSLGDYHTQILPPDDVQTIIGDSERFFPLTAQMVGEQAYITANYSGNAAIPLGAELLAINDIPIATLQSAAEKYFPPARPLTSFKLWPLFGSLPAYQVTFLPPDAATPLTQTVPGMTGAAIMPQVAATYTPVEAVTYTTLPGEPIGVLMLNTFGAGLGPSLKAAFTQIQADGVQYLILDVRANGGGFYAQVQSIMDYLANKSYRSCARSLQAPFRGYGSGDPREMECEVIQPFAVAERYQGNLYLLIGPDTFSAAITLATILQDDEMALLVGEETGDSASYCADLPSEMRSLPRTGLLYHCSQTCYVRPNGVLDDPPVVPDITVKTTIADVLAGNDPVLAYTLELIRAAMP